MKKSTFVSFSSMIQHSVQSKKEAPPPSEPEVDYETLYKDSIQENERLLAQLSEQQQHHEQEKLIWDKEREDFQRIVSICEDQLSVWKSEVREHIYSIWTSFLQQLIQDPNFHQVAVHDMISQAIMELSDKKNIHVEVSPEFLELTEKLLSGRSGWTISTKEDLQLGVRFSHEQVFWKTELDPVFQSFFELLENWVKEKE
ncbi:MAG: hypothetical protein CL916_13125 [Deltaproteobacteria bacterium]|nr:hypothetical protein [Deltaproteobacteria bacterium]